MKNNNIYIIGRVIGSYRTQNLVKFLLDQNKQIYFDSTNTSLFFGKTVGKRLLRLIFRGIEELIKTPTKLYNLLISDVVILTAMCNNYQLELYLAKLFGKTIISDYYISFYDTFVLDRKTVAKGSRKEKKLIKQDSNIINKSNLILFLNSSEANYYLNLLNFSFDSKKHIIIPLCIEESVKCKLNYLHEERDDRVFNICWWGNYIPLHGLDHIIDASLILHEKYDLNFHLYLFGSDDEKSKKYKEKIKELDLENIISIDNTCSFKNGKLGDFLINNCDLVLGNFGNSDKAKNILPNKLVDGVAMKAPVLTGESIGPHEFFSENEVFYTGNLPHLIAEKMYLVSQLKKDKIMAQVERAYLVYKEVFSVNAFNENLKKLFSKIEL